MLHQEAKTEDGERRTPENEQKTSLYIFRYVKSFIIQNISDFNGRLTNLLIKRYPSILECIVNFARADFGVSNNALWASAILDLSTPTFRFCLALFYRADCKLKTCMAALLNI